MTVTGLVLALALVTAAVPVRSPDLAGLESAVAAQISEMQRLAGDQPAAGAYGDLGQVYLAYGFNDAAADCFRNAAVLEKKDARWPYLLGAADQAAGRLDEAAAAFTQALGLAPDAAAGDVRLGALPPWPSGPRPPRFQDRRGASRSRSGRRAGGEPAPLSPGPGLPRPGRPRQGRGAPGAVGTGGAEAARPLARCRDGAPGRGARRPDAGPGGRPGGAVPGRGPGVPAGPRGPAGERRGAGQPRLGARLRRRPDRRRRSAPGGPASRSWERHRSLQPRLPAGGRRAGGGGRRPSPVRPGVAPGRCRSTAAPGTPAARRRPVRGGAGGVCPRRRARAGGRGGAPGRSRD